MVGAPTILVADDEPGCRDLYDLWLAEYDTRIASDGREALKLFDADVDLALLDRSMPGPSGTDLAARLDEAEGDCHVALVSSLRVDFDLAASPVDDYVQKPVKEADIEGILTAYERAVSYREALDEYFALTAELGAIESDRTPAELEGNERYRRLRERAAEKRAEVDEALRAEETDWASAFRVFDTSEGEAANASQSAACRTGQ